MSLGKRLKAIRKAKKLTQKQIAAGTGKTERYYQAVEYDEVNPGFDFILALANYLSLGLDELVGREAAPRGLENKIPAAEKRSLVYVSIAGRGDDIRGEVIRSLLEIDCLAAGMLDGPSGNDDSLNLIERAIDDSDYYVLIIRGGGLNFLDLSLVRAEAGFAVKLDKPRASFADNPRALGKIFGHDAARLGICKLWSTAEDLGNAVGRNVLRLRKDHPTKGWMRGDEITKEQLLTEKSLRARIDELERRLREAGG